MFIFISWIRHTWGNHIKKYAVRVLPHAFGTRCFNNSYGGVETYRHCYRTSVMHLYDMIKTVKSVAITALTEIAFLMKLSTILESKKQFPP